MDIKKILRKVSKYLVEYREKHQITQHEMANMIGLSISRYSEIERNMGHSGLALKTLIVIAQLEHDSLTDFFMGLEGHSFAGVPKKDAFALQLNKINKPLKSYFIKRVQKDNKLHQTIPNKLQWTLELMNLILEGKYEQLEEIEIYVLSYYLSHIAKNSATSKAAKARLLKLVKNKDA